DVLPIYLWRQRSGIPCAPECGSPQYPVRASTRRAASAEKRPRLLFGSYTPMVALKICVHAVSSTPPEPGISQTPWAKLACPHQGRPNPDHADSPPRRRQTLAVLTASVSQVGTC